MWPAAFSAVGEWVGVHVSQGSACLIASPEEALHPHACSTGSTVQHAFVKAPALRKHKRIALAWLSCVQSFFICHSEQKEGNTA